jgi:hypothetical protein
MLAWFLFIDYFRIMSIIKRLKAGLHDDANVVVLRVAIQIFPEAVCAAAAFALFSVFYAPEGGGHDRRLPLSNTCRAG